VKETTTTTAQPGMSESRFIASLFHDQRDQFRWHDG
jgi:hypothetical protein